MKRPSSAPCRLLLPVILLSVAYASGQSANGVKWITARDNPSLWTEIRNAFREELEPDDPAKTAPVVAYSYKYIYRVALHDQSALVRVGYRESKDGKYPGYYSAFNLDLTSQEVTAIKTAAAMSNWRFIKFSRLAATLPEDVLFTYMTCSECEPSKILSSFYYDSAWHRWTLRSWQSDKNIWWTSDSGPVIWTDVYGGDDMVSFDCLYGFLGDDHEGFAIRCREVHELETKKFEVTDITLRYTFVEGDSKLERIRDQQERIALTTELCQQSPRHKLCSIR